MHPKNRRSGHTISEKAITPVDGWSFWRKGAHKNGGPLQDVHDRTLVQYNLGDSLKMFPAESWAENISGREGGQSPRWTTPEMFNTEFSPENISGGGGPVTSQNILQPSLAVAEILFT